MKKQFPIISFEHVSFQYEGQTRENLKDINLTIKSGEFLVITGQSGCGKTTLTRCINNLIPRFFEGTLSGEVIVSGRSIKESDAGEAGKEIASIFQDPRSQFFTTNSSSEVAFACENYGIPHKEIVKRVIGLPGDTITYKDDVLYVNGKKTYEPYLDKYQKAFEDDDLQDIYSYNTLFQQLAESSDAFTTAKDGSTEFTVKVPKNQYFLLGDDRIVSKDSREVGSFKKSAIVGEVKFRFWPLSKIGGVN